MYSFLQSGSSLYLKNQVRENIFSLLGNCGKTLYTQNSTVYAEISLPWYQTIQKIVHDIWETPYKKLVGYCLILLSATMIAPPSTSFAATETQKTFIVTAYYSPLPGQSFYLKGNYEAEIRLNGNGTNGAS